MRDLLMTKYNSEMQKEKNRIKKLLAYKFIKGRTMFPFMSLAVSARLLWQALLEKLGDESFSFLRFFCFWSSCMAAGASGSVSDGKSERERQEGVGSMALPEPWRPDWETETCIIMGCSWGLTGEHGTFKITCLYAFHTVRAVPRLLLISIFRAKTSVNEGTEGPSYKKKTNNTAASPFHYKVSLTLWFIFKHSSYLFWCILKQGLFFSLSENEHRWWWVFKCWHPRLRKCSHLLCAEQVRHTNTMMRSSASCRHAELIDRGKFNINHTFFQCLQFLNDVYLLDISSGRNFI